MEERKVWRLDVMNQVVLVQKLRGGRICWLVKNKKNWASGGSEGRDRG